MLLLGSAAFFQIFLSNYTPIINGQLGIGIPNFFAWAGSYSTLGATLLISAFALVVYVYAERMANPPLGRTLRALRDNEAAAEALGKDTVVIRRNILIIASIITGVAGALYTIYTGDTNPAIYDRVTWTFWPWLIVILGGVASNSGVAIGTFVFIFLLQYIDATKFYLQNVLPFDVTWLEYLLFGSLLILVLLLRPQGILPEKPSHTLSNSESLESSSTPTAGRKRRPGRRRERTVPRNSRGALEMPRGRVTSAHRVFLSYTVKCGSANMARFAEPLHRGPPVGRRRQREDSRLLR